jgi:hypothetical protein
MEVVVAVVPAIISAYLGVLSSFTVVFPTVPGTSPDVLVTLALAFPSWCLPFAAAAASERQQHDRYQPVEGSVEDSSLVVVG